MSNPLILAVLIGFILGLCFKTLSINKPHWYLLTYSKDDNSDVKCVYMPFANRSLRLVDILKSKKYAGATEDMVATSISYLGQSNFKDFTEYTDFNKKEEKTE